MAIKQIVIVVFFGYLGCARANLSHADAAKRLSDAGITISSSGKCTNRNNAACTSLDQIREDTIKGIITFKKVSGCPVIVTGGTETGHGNGAGQSHWNGWKLDIGMNPCVTKYITSNFKHAGIRGDGAAMYKSASGNIYANEGNHWDIVYVNCGGC